MPVAICIITCDRPAGLRKLLASIAAQALGDGDDGPSIEIVVIDNAGDALTHAIVRELVVEFPFPLRYGVEPRRGIPFARNTALDAVGADAEWIAFIDDDETAVSTWLASLFRAARDFDADVVAGPVLPVFDASAPAWAQRGNFFAYARHPHGSVLAQAYTGNILIKRSLLHERPFDERIAHTGGSDTLLLRQLAQRGAKIVWADDAIVHEHVPASRTTPAWIARRAFRLGLMRTRIDQMLDGPLIAFSRALANGFYRIAKGAILSLPALARSREHRIECVRQLCFGAGRVAGIIGVRFSEYRSKSVSFEHAEPQA